MRALRALVQPATRRRIIVALLGVPALLIALLLTHLFSDSTAGEAHVAVTTSAGAVHSAAASEAGEFMADCGGPCSTSPELLELTCFALLLLLFAAALPLVVRFTGDVGGPVTLTSRFFALPAALGPKLTLFSISRT